MSWVLSWLEFPEAMFNSNFLIASLIWGSVGSVFAIYGWRQKAMVPLFGGIAMVTVSYAVPSALWMSLACAGLIAGVICLRRLFPD